MKVLLTGAFGNVGRSALTELLQHDVNVRCFDVPTRTNQKAAARAQRELKHPFEIMWGDLRNPEDVFKAVQGVDVVLHLAFVIPKLSATGVNCEDRPDWAREINVGGTANLIHAMQAQTPPPRLIFTSSLHIYGHTQTLPPPRTVQDVPCPVEHYAHHKVECEKLVRESGLQWCIFRLGAALPMRLIMDPGMFDVPLNNRIEFVHTRDVGFALANALDNDEVWGKTLHIGGGRGCQVYYREMMQKVLGATGVGELPDGAFTTEEFATDWLDTAESQRILHFQRHTLDDYARQLRKKVGALRGLIITLRPLVRLYLLSFSPYRR